MGLFSRIWKNFALPLSAAIAKRSRLEIEAGCFLLMALIATAEYLERVSMSLTVLYAIPLSILAWYVGAASAFMLSVLSVIVWLAIYMATHAHPTYLMMSSVMLLRFCFFTFVSVVVARLNHLQHNLEALAETRAQALAKEVAERERLEREMLEISEREQRRIGQDLHDGLCQLLTGTALAGHAHARSLAIQGNFAEAEKARKIVNFIEEAILLARAIAKGLDPIELQSDGLMQALEEFASTTSELCGVRCQFGCHVPVLIHSPNTAVHLYRIAQEAVGNAVKHGHATAIDVLLEETDVGLQLSITDNGKGLPIPFPKNGGMGLRTMTVRAKLAGGQFSIRPLAAGGAEVTCIVPEAANA